MTSEEKTKKKKNNNKSADGAENGRKKQSKKKEGPKDLKKAESKKKPKKSKSEKSDKKKAIKKLANQQSLDVSNHSDDLPDSPLRDGPKKTATRSTRSLSLSNHSTDLGSIRERSAVRVSRARTSLPGRGPGRGFGGRGPPPDRGVRRAVSTASMSRPSARPGGMLSQSAHEPRPGLGSRQPSILRNSQRNTQPFEKSDLGEGSRPPSTRILTRPNQSTRIDMDGSVTSSGQSKGRARLSLARTRSGQSVTSMSMSTHSLDDGFPNDPKWKEILRSLNMLPPTPNENPIQRKQRAFIWASMILDFVAALVSITTYDGVTTCCKVPIFDIASAVINWDKFIRITTYIYMTMIFIEIVPVFTKGLPINMINPFLGFTITFAMFFDDRILEAVAMWAIEAIAVVFEVLVTRLKVKEYNEGEERINACTVELDMRKTMRKSKSQSRLSNASFDSVALENDDDFELGNNDLKELDKFRIERERRRSRVTQSAEAISLRYHYIGTIINCSLVVLSMSLIIGIAKNGGLCIYHLEAPNLFADGQLDLCSACKDTDDDDNVCEICDVDGIEHQCYYSYF